jgi:hypothetical protein
MGYIEEMGDRDKQAKALREKILTDGKELEKALWKEIASQAKRAANNPDVAVDPYISDFEQKIAVPVKPKPQGPSTNPKTIEVHRGASAIEVRGTIDMDLEFALRDGELCLKHDGKPLSISEAAELVLSRLYRA